MNEVKPEVKKSAQETVDTIIHAYYHEHHNLNTYRRQLSEAIEKSRLVAFSETKERLTYAIEARIALRVRDIMTVDTTSAARENSREHILELETLRAFVKGLVIEV